MIQIFLIYSFLLVFVNCKTLLFDVRGLVNKEEFIYYKIMQPGNLLLELETLEGDADIYISGKTPTPNFYPDNYDYHSATCGVDTVFIPQSLQRPIMIGIYGYSAYDTSKFNLIVHQLPNTENFFSDEETENSTEEETEINNSPKTKQGEKLAHKAQKKLKFARDGIGPFLDLLETLFL